MHACIHTYMHACMHACMHKHTYIYINKWVREALRRYGRYQRYERYQRYRRAGRVRPTWQGVPQPIARFADAALAANLAIGWGTPSQVGGNSKP